MRRFPCWSPRRLIEVLVLAAGSLAVVVVVADDTRSTGSTPPDSVGRSNETSDRAKQDGRLREGSRLVEVPGEFHDTGDRIIFQPSEMSTSFQTLENLALERISRALDTPTPRLWSVTGTVTEFRNANYLFVTRAVLKAKKPAAKRAPVSK